MPTPPIIPSARKKRFQEKLLLWYSEHARDLPWRETRDPYRIMVSEIMLQQTQVDRVIEKYHEWLEKFPTVETLAKAPQKNVVAAWQGLGYNRRALYLHKAAKKIVSELDGIFPSTIDGLQELPGIGPYTSGAIASFAFGAETSILDTNVKRVVGRILLGYKALSKTAEAELWELVGSLLPRKRDVYNFNQALMDFGAMICTQRKPSCGECPYQRMCKSYPKILDAKPAELKLPSVKETLYFGKPRRIWRGKILKYLHECENESATVNAIGKAIQDDYSTARTEWLQSVLDTLIKDELIVQKKQRVTLPE